MTHRNVETTIGRLVSDEVLRTVFRNSPREAIGRLRREGLELSAIEADALASLDPDQLARLAKSLDPRLQRASLAPKRRSRLGPGMLYILLQLASASACADTHALASPAPMLWGAQRTLGLPRGFAPQSAGDAARSASSLSAPSTLGWHRETGGRAEPLRFFVLTSARKRGEP